MSTLPSNIAILREVQSRRRGENVANAFKLVGMVCLVLFATWLVMVLAAPHRIEETTGFVVLLVSSCFYLAIDTTIKIVIVFWPFLLYLWASVRAARQWTLLSLLQTSIETGKPLQNIVWAYAAGCSKRYAARLNRFAAALESGYSLDAAIREHRKLFRYDIAGMIRLGDSPETLLSLEAVAQDERDFAGIRTYNVFRIIYLCMVVFWMLLLMSFLFMKIVPEFEKIFVDFGSQLPSMTAVVISTSQFAVQYWYLMAPFAVLIILSAVAYLILQTNAVTFRPIGFRRIFYSTDAAKFLRIFAVGVRHRFSIPAILERYRWTVPSDYLRQKGMRIQKSVEQGGVWIDAVRRVGFVNEPEASLLRSAERTGNLATVLDQLAQSKERSQIRKDDLFSKLMFIPLVFLLGGVIGTFVIGMFMPLLKLVSDLAV